MAHLKLHVDEFDEIDYQLIAIHTSLEEYRLAFLINQKFNVLLSRCETNICITGKNGTAELVRYVYEDEKSSICWNLLQNKSEIFRDASVSAPDLFSGENIRVAGNAFLVPEYRKVDYFLQLQNTCDLPSDLHQSLQEIPKISMCYSVDTENIKSRNNLIF